MTRGQGRVCRVAGRAVRARQVEELTGVNVADPVSGDASRIIVAYSNIC